MSFPQAEGTNTVFRLDFVIAFIGCYHFCRAMTGRKMRRRSARLIAAASPAPPPPSSLLCASEPHSWLESMTVFVADFFNKSLTALRGRFFPDAVLVNSEMKDETRFLPSSLATGKIYVFIKGIATRPIRKANAPMPPELNCRAGS